MTMDFALLKAALDLATKALPSIMTADAKTKGLWKVAVSRLQIAVLETQAYVAALERGEAADRTKEQ